MSTTRDSLKDIRALTDTLIRYVVSGGVFLLAWGYLDCWRLGFLRIGSEGKDISLYLTTLFIFVFGAVSYTVHRAIAYRFVLPILMFFLIVVRWLRSLPVGSCSPFDLDRDLTQKRWEARKKDDALQSHFDRWGSEVHLLYTSSLSLFFALGLFWVTKSACASEWNPRKWTLI